MTWMPVKDSFLGWTFCPGAECGAAVLSIEAHADRAWCEACLKTHIGGVPAYVGEIGPVCGGTPIESVPREVAGYVPDMVLPEVTSRDPWPADVAILDPVVKLVALAGVHGWISHDPAYSRRGAEQLISVKVRHRHEGLAGHAVYRTATGKSWAWSEFWIYADGAFPMKLPLLADFQAVLIQGPKVELAALVTAIGDMQEIAKNGAALAKRRTAVRAEIRRHAAMGAEWLAGQEWVAEFYTRDEVEKLLARPVGGRREGAS